MIKGNIITIYNGELSEEVFKYYPVWCEYYEPSEIDNLVGLGENLEFLEKELIGNVESSEGQNHPYYTLPKNDLIEREFLYIYCRIKLFDCFYGGYVVLASNKITSFTIFHHNKEYLFSLNDILNDDNRDNMLLLTSQRITESFTLSYSLMCNTKVLKETGAVEIPCS
jgi:hypothetical protein